MKIDKSTLPDIVPMLQPKGTRFLLDLIPQIDRALEKSSNEAVLILGMCPNSILSTGCLDHPSCRTEKIYSAMELPGGLSVIHLDLRVDCIRFHQGQRKNCLAIDDRVQTQY